METKNYISQFCQNQLDLDKWIYDSLRNHDQNKSLFEDDLEHYENDGIMSFLPGNNDRILSLECFQLNEEIKCLNGFNLFDQIKSDSGFSDLYKSTYLENSLFDCQDFDYNADWNHYKILNKFEDNSENKFFELKQKDIAHFSHNQLKNSGCNIVDTTIQYLNKVDNLSKNLSQSQIESDEELAWDQVQSIKKEKKEISLKIKHQGYESSTSSNSNFEKMNNLADEWQDIEAQNKEHIEYLVSQQHWKAFEDKFINCDKQENNSVSWIKKGRPKKERDISKKVIKEVFKDHLKTLCIKLKKEHRSDSKNAIVFRSIKCLPDDILKSVCSAAEYKHKDTKIVFASYFKAYIAFISCFGSFNDDILQGFIDFILLKFPETRVYEIIDNLEAYCSISNVILSNQNFSKHVFEKIREQLKIRTRASKAIFNQLYKLNSCYKFIWNLIIQKIEKDEVIFDDSCSESINSSEKSTMDIMKSIKDILELLQNLSY